MFISIAHLPTLLTKGIDISGLVTSSFEVGPVKPEPGSLVKIPALYPNKGRLILDINVKADPTEKNLEAVIRPLSQRSIHIPIKSLNLASNEHAFVVTGKIRPAIVLAGGQSKWATSPYGANLHLRAVVHSCEAEDIAAVRS